MPTNKDENEHLYFIPKRVMYPNSPEHDLKNEITRLKERIEILKCDNRNLEKQLEKFNDLENKFENLQKQINDVEREVWRIDSNNCIY